MWRSRSGRCIRSLGIVKNKLLSKFGFWTGAFLGETWDPAYRGCQGMCLMLLLARLLAARQARFGAFCKNKEGWKVNPSLKCDDGSNVESVITIQFTSHDLCCRTW